MKITRRMVEKESSRLLALLRANPHEQVEVQDRNGKTLYFVSLGPVDVSSRPVEPRQDGPPDTAHLEPTPEPQHDRKEAFLKLKAEMESKRPVEPVRNGPLRKNTARHVFGHVERSDVKYTNSFGA